MNPKPRTRRDWPYRVFMLTHCGEACCGCFPDGDAAVRYIARQRISERLIRHLVPTYPLIVKQRIDGQWIEVDRWDRCNEPSPLYWPEPEPKPNPEN